MQWRRPYPRLVVFDLDACLWDKEMYVAVSAPAVLSTQLLPLDPPLNGALAFLAFWIPFSVWCLLGVVRVCTCACCVHVRGACVHGAWCMVRVCVVHCAMAVRAPRYAMPELPSRPVSGPLRAAGEGVAAVHSGHHRIRLHPGALRALQEIHAGEVSKLEEPL
jgi:hypothetical protein